MPANRYEFLTRWQVQGTAEEVYNIMLDMPGYTSWWSEVYLDVQEVQPEPAGRPGREFKICTKGRLPYTLRWTSREAETQKPGRITIEATGDFLGRGIWTFQQDGEFVDILFDWRLDANKPLIRYLSFLLKPIFAANHRWAMARGEEGLRSELARRRRRAS